MTNLSPISTGIDVNAIVSSLMDVEKLSLKKLDKDLAVLQYQQDHYDNFKGLLKKFSDSLDNLNDVFNNHSWTVNSSDNSVASTVLTGSNVSAGQHSIQTTQLAQIHQVASAAFATKTSALDINGSLNITTGRSNFSLTINAGDTLETIRDNINNSLNNNTLSASILSTTASDGTAEFHLLLSSRETGLINEMQFSGDATSFLNLDNTFSEAKDALFTVDGFSATRSSNTVSDVLDGIIFTLNSAPGSATINVIPDNENKRDTIKSAIKSMVDNYNSLMDVIDRNQSTKSTRDSTWSLLKLRLKNMIGTETGNASNINKLLDMGIKTAESALLFNEDGVEYASTGKLSIDEDKLSRTFNDCYEDMKSFFTASAAGFISTYKNELTDINKEGGNISYREKTIQQQESSLNQRIGREESRLDFVKEALIRRYSELNTFVQRYQQMSNFLEQQLDSLTNIYKK